MLVQSLAPEEREERQKAEGLFSAKKTDPYVQNPSHPVYHNRPCLKDSITDAARTEIQIVKANSF